MESGNSSGANCSLSLLCNTSYNSNGTEISLNGTNSGLSDYEKLVLKFVTWFALLVMVTSVFINGLCLIAFYQERRLRTVFNYYLICLTVTDFLYALISMPNFIVLNYFGFWPLGEDCCNFYLWADWTLSAGVQNTVMLIGLDRVWALYWPFSYRRHRSRKVTSAIITVMWATLLLCIVPGIVINRLTNTDPSICEVSLDTPAKQVWGTFVNFFNYILPEVVVVTCFAMTAAKIRKQTKVQSTQGQKAAFQPQNATVTVNVTAENVSTTNSRLAKDRRLFRMFALLTLFMIICWMPGNVFWTMYNLDPSVYSFSMSMTVSLLMFTNSVTNPLFYQTGSNEMRGVILRLLRISQPNNAVKTRRKLTMFSGDTERTRPDGGRSSVHAKKVHTSSHGSSTET